MPAKIDQTLLPPVIRESVDPDILNRAQSIEWSINRDVGEDEHGYMDGSHEDYLSSQNLMYKTHYGKLVPPGYETNTYKSSKQVEWFDQQKERGRDSGFDYSPTTPSIGRNESSLSANQPVDLSPLDDVSNRNASELGSMKRHPQGQYPYPIYKVNQEQLKGDVFFEVAPRAQPGERTVHYEKSTRILNEEELNALNLDSSYIGPNSNAQIDEQEEEMIETSVLKGGSRELEDLYKSMRNPAGQYFDRERARSASPDHHRADFEDHQKKTIVFGSVEEIDKHEQEYFPYRDAHQGKVSIYIYILMSF